MTLPTVASFLDKTRKSWDPAIAGAWPDTVLTPVAPRPDAANGPFAAPPARPLAQRDGRQAFMNRLLGIA